MRDFGKIANKAIFVICLVLLIMLGAFTTLYSDDFVYGTYCLDGAAEFIRKNAEHYRNVNGRAFVHLVLEGILYFKDTLFRFVLPVMLLLVGEMFYRLCGETDNKGDRTGFLNLYLCGVMIIPLAVMREGILWMSGAVNYILPTILVIEAFVIITKSIENNKVRAVYYPAAFLCGATTEQGGAAALCVCVLWTFYCIIRKKHVIKNVYILIFIMMIGYLTVILSPATFGRMTGETSEAVVDLAVSAASFCEKLVVGSGLFWIFAFSGFVSSCICARRNILVFGLGIVGVIIAAVMRFCGNYIAAFVILTVIIIFNSIFMLYKGICEREAVLMTAAMISVLMLMFSTTFGNRNFLPFCLIMLCVCAFEINNFITGFSEKANLIFGVAVFVCSFVYFAPTFSGYRDNRRIINDNLNTIYSSDGDIEYDMDIERKYSYTQFYEYDEYGYGFKRIYDIGNERKIFLCGSDFRELVINNNRCENPIYVKNGTEYYPLREVVEANNGKIEWDNNERIAKITLNGVEVCYDAVMKRFEKDGKFYDSESYKLNEEDKYGRYFISHVYMTKEHLTELLGIEV